MRSGGKVKIWSIAAFQPPLHRAAQRLRPRAVAFRTKYRSRCTRPREKHTRNATLASGWKGFPYQGCLPLCSSDIPSPGSEDKVIPFKRAYEGSFTWGPGGNGRGRNMQVGRTIRRTCISSYRKRKRNATRAVTRVINMEGQDALSETGQRTTYADVRAARWPKKETSSLDSDRKSDKLISHLNGHRRSAWAL